MYRTILTAFSLACASMMSAQVYLVEDINPGINPSNIDEMVATPAGVALFQADDGTNGTELWRTDGTAAGTVMIKNIAAGSNSSNPAGFAVAPGGVALFRADDGVNGNELWRTDGTSAGTQMITNLNPGAAHGAGTTTDDFATPLYSNGVMFVQLNDGVNGTELWKTDGTPGGTQMIADINPAGSSNPRDFVAVSSGLIFSAEGPSGRELYFSDGTGAGTVLLADINGSGDSNPTDFYKATGGVYFSADDGTNGRELWKTDGTTLGTALVMDIHPSGDANPVVMEGINGQILFYANDGTHGIELWISDGTSGGTSLVSDINPSGDGLGTFSAHLFYASRMYFAAQSSDGDVELYVTDGTNDGTFMVKDNNPGSAGSYPQDMVIVGTRFIYSAETTANGRELWYSDGTEYFTGIFSDLNLGAACSCPENLTSVGEDVFMALTTPSVGSELYIFDTSMLFCAGFDSSINYGFGTVGTHEEVSTVCGGAPISGGCNANPGKSVWFRHQAGSLSTLQVRCSDLHGIDGNMDVSITLLDDSFNELACVDDNGNHGQEHLVYEDLTPMGVYWIVIQDKGSFHGIFDLQVNVACTIDAITLGSQSACNPLDNTYSQEVTIDVFNPIVSGDLIVNGQTFPALSGDNTVQLSDLYSSGQGVDLDIQFTDFPGCNDVTINAFSAPDPCIFVGDICEDAVVLPVNTICDPVMYVAYDATTSSGYPDPSCGFYQGGDMWFSAEVPVSGQLAIELSLGVGHYMTVYQGDCNALTELECDNDYIAVNDPSMAGQTLYIRVYRFNSASNMTFFLCAYDPNTPENDMCETATELAVGTECNMYTFTNLGCTTQDGLATSSCGFFQGTDVWFTAVMPASGMLRFEIDGISNTTPQMSLYSGTCGAFTEIECDNDFITINDVSLAGETLYLRVWRYNSEKGGTFDLCVWEPAIPDNDFCENAFELTVGATCVPQTYSNAWCTGTPGYPTPFCGFYQGGDAWFTAVVPASGHLSIEVAPLTNSNPQVSIYTGTCTGGFSQRDCDNDIINIHDETLAGETIYIRVATYNSEEGGTFDICAWEPAIPDNDFCSEAFPLAVGTSCTMVEYTNANTTNTDDVNNPNPYCGFYKGGDVWFTLEMPASGHLFIDTDAGTNTHPCLALYSGTCGALTIITCDASSSDVGSSGEITIHDETLAGETLYLRVFQYNNENGGTFDLCAMEPSIPDNDFCDAATPLAAVTGACNFTQYSNQYCTSSDVPSPNPNCGFYQGADAWFSFMMPASGQAVISSESGSLNIPVLALYSGSCGSFTLLDCDVNSSEDNMGKIIISDVGLAGQVLYLRVFGYATVNGGSFGLCIYDPTLCGIEGVTIGTQTSCVPATNYYTQEVIVDFVNPPATGDINVNGQIFSISGSPQSVVVTALDSDELPVDLTVMFTDAPACMITIPEAWIAPPNCCPGDYNDDLVVNTEDLLLFLGSFGCTGCPQDINADGIVDTADLLIFLGMFGQVCP
ncbi:MAG: hypothetical protein KDC12_01565 [Flavobacteriales bacterium]|nr:hypothetical protein [Flavobacteriales bacterium]